MDWIQVRVTRGAGGHCCRASSSLVTPGRAVSSSGIIVLSIPRRRQHHRHGSSHGSSTLVPSQHTRSIGLACITSQWWPPTHWVTHVRPRTWRPRWHDDGRNATRRFRRYARYGRYGWNGPRSRCTHARTGWHRAAGSPQRRRHAPGDESSPGGHAGPRDDGRGATNDDGHGAPIWRPPCSSTCCTNTGPSTNTCSGTSTCSGICRDQRATRRHPSSSTSTSKCG